MKNFPKWKVILILIVCLIGSIFAFPNFLSDQSLRSLPNWFPKQVMNLGLDLKGGSHLLLEVDFPSYFKEQLEMLRENVRAELKKAKIGYTNLKIKNDQVSLNLRDIEQAEKFEKIFRKNKELSLIKNDEEFRINFSEERLLELKKKLIDQSREIIRRRVDETGTKEPIIQSHGEDKILLQVPGLNDPEHLKKMLGQTAKMSFHLVNESIIPSEHLTFDTVILELDGSTKENPQRVPIYKKVLINGDLLSNANVGYNQYSKPVVEFEFNHLGAKIFGELTRQNVGKRLAIVLDNKVICAPTIVEPILTGSGNITGNYTAQSANDLALLLRAGALPAPLNVIEERTVGPSLGLISINQGKEAAIISVIAVMIFMVIAYGVFGIFANIALCFNLIFLIALLSCLQATLTLPGIAGIVLTMGMSVDANVLIFERIREESKNGLSPVTSLERGFNQAFNTIIDSNLTTILVAVFLYAFGSGAVKGFAVTLAIGISTSMFSAVTLTRLIVSFWFHRVRPKKLT